MDYMNLKQEDYIFGIDKRVDPNLLYGEYNVLNSPLIEEAFNFILNDYTPKHKNVIFSLCTKSRPYILSKKWEVIDKCFGDTCDLVVCSNGRYNSIRIYELLPL